MTSKHFHRKHFPRLDAIRGFAAVGVCLHHLYLFLLQQGITSSLSSLAAHNLLVYAGARCVQIFCVLSGFLITYILLHESRKSTHIDLTRFAKKRLFRIMPAYIFTIAIAFILMSFAHHQLSLFAPNTAHDSQISSGLTSAHFALYLSGLSNVAKLKGLFWPGINHTWSIGLEIQFYIIWSVACYYAIRFIPQIAGLVICIYFALDLSTGFKDIAIVQPISWQPFMFGVLAAVAFDKGWFKSGHRSAYPITLCAILVFMIRPVPETVFCLTAAVLVFLSLKPHTPSIWTPLTSWLGQISYSLYLIHPIILFLSVRPLLGYGIPLYIVVSTYLSASLMMSYLLFRFLEKPMTDLGRRI